MIEQAASEYYLYNQPQYRQLFNVVEGGEVSIPTNGESAVSRVA